MSNVVVKDIRYMNEGALDNIVSYALRIETEELGNPSTRVRWGGSGILMKTPLTAIQSFNAIKNNYEKNNGNLLHHVIITLDCEKMNRKDLLFKATNIGEDVCYELYCCGFQSMYFVHNDTKFVHVHFVINSINFTNGNRIQSTGTLGNTILELLKMRYRNLGWMRKVIYKSSDDNDIDDCY